VGMIAKVGAAIQLLFGKVCDEAAESSGVIQRKRKFSATALLQTFVMGFLKDPEASDEDLAQMAAQCGVEVTPQAIERRHTPRLAKFLQEVAQQCGRIVVSSDRALAPILERFSSVSIKDGSAVQLPESQQKEFAGCGGSYGAGKAALKLQTELELRHGRVTFDVEAGRCPDAASPRQHELHGPGSLHIRDLGYFNLDVFATQDAAGEYFLSRLQFGTDVMLRETDAESCEESAVDLGGSANLMAWLAKQDAGFVDRSIFLGKEKKLRCRLIAWRLPQAQADRRRRKLREEMKRKGREPSEERLAWCDWTILVTNVPVEMLTPQEATVLYRARWQVELLFKRWKSLNLIAVLSGSTDVRQMIRIWSRIIMSLVQHWLMLGWVWGDPSKSWTKVCRAIRGFASRLAAALSNMLEVERVLSDLRKVFSKTCRRNKRSKPGTMELLNDVELLEFELS
jgi:hypothetical protein